MSLILPSSILNSKSVHFMSHRPCYIHIPAIPQISIRIFFMSLILLLIPQPLISDTLPRHPTTCLAETWTLTLQMQILHATDSSPPPPTATANVCVS